MHTTETVQQLSNQELISSTKRLSKTEHECIADVVLRLSEIDARELFLELGYSSLFAYCTKVLLLSESSASRIAAARLIRKYPEVYQLLRTQQVSLANLSRIASVINDDNKDDVLARIIGTSKSDVEMLRAELVAPKKQTPKESIKPVVCTTKTRNTKSKDSMPLFAKENTSTLSSATSTKQEDPEPETEKRFEFKFSLPEELMSHYNEVVRLLSSKYPKGASQEEVMRELLNLFLKHKSPKKREERRAARDQNQDKQKAPSRENNSKSIPTALRDEVLKRDNHQCTFVASDGTRCCSTWDLEVDHIHPKALKGKNSLDNLRTLCRPHNLHEAKRIMGAPFIESHYRACGNLQVKNHVHGERAMK